MSTENVDSSLEVLSSEETTLMAKDKASGTAKRSSVKPKKQRRVILFPTEPTTIPREELERAIDKVIAARKK
jgi:hypothetical protein